MGTLTPATDAVAPAVFGLVATCCGSGKDADVAWYGVPIVDCWSGERTCGPVEAEGELDACVLGLAVVPL